MGVGTGAHGYIPNHEKQGLRYAYPTQPSLFHTLDMRAGQQLLTKTGNWPGTIDVRDMNDWLLEKIAAGARTSAGISVDELAKIHEKTFKPTEVLTRAFERGLLNFTDGHLHVDKQEWFREQSWALEIFDSFCDH